MQLIHKLFNATIVAADGEVPVWDPSVSFWKVYRDGALKGYLYIDPYARAGGVLHPAPDWSTQMARLAAILNSDVQILSSRWEGTHQMHRAAPIWQMDIWCS